MKKALSLFLALVLVMGVFISVPVTVNAASVDDLTFELNEDGGSYSVTGCETTLDGEIVIPCVYKGLPVTSIGAAAFEFCEDLTSITIPDGVTSIGAAAFSNCTSLISITIPDSVTTIGEWAFCNCNILASVTLSNNVTIINDYVFSNCRSLTSIKIPDTVTSVSCFSFYNCTKLKLIDVAENNLNYSSVDGVLFNKDKSTIVKYPAGKIGAEYKILDSVTTIDAFAFQFCIDLKSIIIPESVTNIGRYAFEGTACYEDEDNWENGVLYIDNYLIKGSKALSGSYTIREGTKIIAENAFAQCNNLTSVTITDSVTDIGQGAFSDCKNLTSVTISDNVTTIEDCVFFACEKLLSVVIPNGVNSIGVWAFGLCEKLLSVVIPNSVTTIEEGAFYFCTSLATITIPDSVTSIGASAFADCSSITSITIPSSVMRIGASAFSGCSFTSIEIPSSVEHIDNYAIGYFYNSDTGQEEKIDGFIIYGKSDSFGEIYANENGFEFKGIPDVCSHNLSEWIVGKVATHTEDGLKYKECIDCGEVLRTDVIPATANNFTDVFDSQVFKLWWSVAFSNQDNIYEFSPKHIKWYTVDKIDLYEYYAGEKEVVNEYGSYTYTYSSIPAEVFENEALKHFNITDISILRNETNHDPVYNAETNTYDMPFVGGWGDSITYVTKGYKTDGTGKYDVYGYTVEMAYEKPDDAVEGVDYIMLDDYPAEIVRCLKVTIEYNGTDVKFLSWETISLNDVPDIKLLTHNHVFSTWITDKTATVNATGSKHKECTECGEVLETAVIPQLKPATPKLSKVQNTGSGVKVSWGEVEGADDYIVYRRTYDAKAKKWSGWKNIASGVTTTSYVDKTAKSGTYYIYTVKANNEAGYGGHTSGLKIYFLSTPKVTTANANAGVTVKWTKSAGATGYIVYRKTGNGKWQNLGKTTGTSFTDKTAKAGVTYKYTVKAYYGSYVSAYNTSGVAVRRLTTPKLVKVVSSKSGVTFNWGKVTGATGYIVYRKTGNGSWVKLATVKGNSKISYLDKTAKKGVTYKYTVRAYYGSSTSYYNTKGLTIKDKY